MKIVYVTYFDHIYRNEYDPELTIENWKSCDERVICCSTNQVDLLNTMGLDANIIDVGISIKSPEDIPKAFNKSMDVCFAAGADYVVQMFGDLYITDECDKFIHHKITKEHVKEGYLPVLGVSLYTEMCVHPTQLTISTVQARQVRDITGDGEVLVNKTPLLTDDLSMVLDFGYLGMKQYYSKMRNHIHLWPDKYKAEWIKLYDRGEYVECAKKAYKSILLWRNSSLKPINYSNYEQLIEKLDLKEDYEFCSKLMKDYT